MNKILLTTAIITVLLLFGFLFTGSFEARESMSTRKLPLALELYYQDYGHYPKAHQNKVLIEKLKSGSYLRGSLASGEFNYETKLSGKGYQLTF